MAAASGEAMDALDDLEALQDLAELSASASFSSDNSPPALPDAAVAGPSAEPEPEPEPLGRTPSAEEREAARRAVCQRLQETPFLAHTHERFMHGRGYEGPATLPKATWVSTKKPRDDHDCPSWLKATEFADSPNVALAKAKQLAALLRAARRTVLYTGAGISASAVGQAARSGSATVGFKANPAAARPTLTHFALAFLARQGLVQGWVQQNHDGLPQKAGCPQHVINEIHGSWFDPGNPVVKYSGSLHERAYPWMRQEAETADLVLVLGTSLGGLNADQVLGYTVATNAAHRSLRGGALGTVCINLQQTPQDGLMTLRLFGKSDDVLKLLVQELGFGKLVPRAPAWPKVSKALVPYDKDGRRLPSDDAKWMVLDLEDRAKVRIAPGHNIQGAKQPSYMHIGAARPVVLKGAKRAPAPGNGTVVRRELDHFVLHVEGEGMKLGVWWLVAAMSGAVEALPVVNQKPVFEVKRA